MTMMENILANCNYADEAENYIWYNVTDHDEVEEDVREVLKEYNPTEEEINEYVDNLMGAIDYALGR